MTMTVKKTKFRRSTNAIVDNDITLLVNKYEKEANTLHYAIVNQDQVKEGGSIKPKHKHMLLAWLHLYYFDGS